jgi:epoxyqueuosine reductase QueG
MSLPPQVKYAVYRVTGELTSRCMRKLIEEALAARGWDKAKRDNEYVQYAARCAQRGEQNLFPGGRI